MLTPSALFNCFNKKPASESNKDSSNNSITLNGDSTNHLEDEFHCQIASLFNRQRSKEVRKMINDHFGSKLLILEEKDPISIVSEAELNKIYKHYPNSEKAIKIYNKCLANYSGIKNLYKIELNRLGLKDPFVIFDKQTKDKIMNKDADGAIELYGDELNKYKKSLDLTAKVIIKFLQYELPFDAAFQIVQFSVKGNEGDYLEVLRSLDYGVDVSDNKNKNKNFTEGVLAGTVAASEAVSESMVRIGR